MDVPGVFGPLRDVVSRREAPVYVGAVLRHDRPMQLSWQRFKQAQLDLLDSGTRSDEPRRAVQNGAELQPGPPVGTSQLAVTPEAERIPGVALQVAPSFLYEDATNPRTDFVDTELDELAEDIRVRGILQPIVVHPADWAGHYTLAATTAIPCRRWPAKVRRVRFRERPQIGDRVARP
jgi:hypothetical protein